MPKVSIIVPVYNAASVLKRCINSVLKQDYSDFELILADDGSTDLSASIIDEYAQSDARIKAIHKKNTGVSDTRNHALALAQGTYIQFVDADDWLVPEATGAFVRAAENSGAGMVISDFYRVVGNRSSHKGSIDVDGLISKEDYAENMIRSPADFYYGVLWNKLFRKDIIEQNKLQMDENLQWCEDFIFDMEYILHIDKVYVLRVPLYYYVKTEGSLISKGMNMSDIVRMKLNVIEYYTKFYKNIYSPADYAVKRPIIYGFLLGFAHDDAAIPGLPGTKRLGEERTKAAQEVLLSDLWTQNYYEMRLLERHYRSIALQTKLDIKEIRIIVYIQHFGSINDFKELAEFVGVTQLVLYAYLERLYFRKMINLDMKHPENVKLSPSSDKVVSLLCDALREVSKASRESMTEDEFKQYEHLRKVASGAVRKRLES